MEILKKFLIYIAVAMLVFLETIFCVSVKSKANTNGVKAWYRSPNINKIYDAFQRDINYIENNVVDKRYYFVTGYYNSVNNVTYTAAFSLQMGDFTNYDEVAVFAFYDQTVMAFKSQGVWWFNSYSIQANNPQEFGTIQNSTYCLCNYSSNNDTFSGPTRLGNNPIALFSNGGSITDEPNQPYFSTVKWAQVNEYYYTHVNAWNIINNNEFVFNSPTINNAYDENMIKPTGLVFEYNKLAQPNIYVNENTNGINLIAPEHPEFNERNYVGFKDTTLGADGLVLDLTYEYFLNYNINSKNNTNDRVRINQSELSSNIQMFGKFSNGLYVVAHPELAEYFTKEYMLNNFEGFSSWYYSQNTIIRQWFNANITEINVYARYKRYITDSIYTYSDYEVYNVKISDLAANNNAVVLSPNSEIPTYQQNGYTGGATIGSIVSGSASSTGGTIHTGGQGTDSVNINGQSALNSLNQTKGFLGDFLGFVNSCFVFVPNEFLTFYGLVIMVTAFVSIWNILKP